MNLLIRADGDSQIGTGHVMRCLALAQAWQEGGDLAAFAVGSLSDGLETRLLNEGFGVSHLPITPGNADDAAETASLAQQLGALWVVLDGYHFKADYQRIIKEAGLRLLAVDDYGQTDYYPAELVLNQNLYAEASLYPRHESYTRLLLGAPYALLRREFWPWRGWQRHIPPVARKILITLGGADPDNVTLQAIRALQEIKIEAWEAVVIVGNSNPNLGLLQKVISESSGTIRLEPNVTSMPELMAWADLAVSAGGSTCWELAFMGLPSLILVLAENQQKVAQSLHAAGISINLGVAPRLDPTILAQTLTALAMAPEERTARSQQGQALVDGNGAMRTVRVMKASQINLRPVQADDCRLIWEWANHPTTRSASFSSEPIAWENHLTWFTNTLNDPKTLFYLAIDGEARPIGQIRYQLEDQEAIVSICLAPDQRGLGFGPEIIRLASQRVFEQVPVKRIHAYIKPDNVASSRAFTRAGFVQIGSVGMQEQPALHLVLKKDGHP